MEIREWDRIYVSPIWRHSPMGLIWSMISSKSIATNKDYLCDLAFYMFQRSKVLRNDTGINIF